MKKLLSLSALVVTLFFATQAVAPKNANAVLLVDWSTGHDHHIHGPGELFLCVLFLPVCVLDENATPASTYSSQDLLDNGYSPASVAAIEQDQNIVMDALQSNQQSLVIEKTDTRVTIAKALRAIDPAVSDEYVDFVADLNGIQN